MTLMTGTGRANDKNPQWKGDTASYHAKHAWIYRRKGKASKCTACGKSNGMIHWANKSGKHLRDEKDWVELCVPCHRLFDGHHKFSRTEAIAIRNEYYKGGVSQQKLAERYGVSRCAVVNAIKGRVKAYV